MKTPKKTFTTISKVWVCIKIFFMGIVAALIAYFVMSWLTDDLIRIMSCVLLVGLLFAVDEFVFSDFVPSRINKYITQDKIIFDEHKERERIFYKRLHKAWNNGIAWSVGIIVLSIWFKSLTYILIFVVLYMIYSVTLGFKREFANNAKNTTCPKCKAPFAYKQKTTYGKKLNREYKTKAVEEGYGNDKYTRRGVFAYGEQEVQYTDWCLKCGYIGKVTSTTRYEEEV